MTWVSLSPILISVGVIAAAIAAIANVVVAIMNNTRLRAIEKGKREDALIQYRYTKLYSILEQLGKMGIVFHAGDANRTIRENLNNRKSFIELYHIARPLLESHIRMELEASANFENEKHAALTEAIRNNNQSDFENGLPDWSNAIGPFIDALIRAIQEQILALMNLGI